MSGISSSLSSPPRYRRLPPRPRSEGKRAKIVDAAMRHFAEQGYHAARVGDIASALGIAKGSIFQHFGSKDGLFFETYKKAVRSFPRYLDAPAEVREGGFFEVLRYWLVRTEHLIHEDWIPYGTVPFVRFGLERAELRRDLDQEMIVSILDWTMERFQDALLTEELDPGLFRRQGNVLEKKEARIAQFLDVLRRAIGADQRG